MIGAPAKTGRKRRGCDRFTTTRETASHNDLNTYRSRTPTWFMLRCMSGADDDLLPGPPAPPERVTPVAKYLSKTEVAEYLGMRAITSLVKVVLPPHDAQIGKIRGWCPATIDAWVLTRPGKGRRGARTGQRRGGGNAPPGSKSG